MTKNKNTFVGIEIGVILVLIVITALIYYSKNKNNEKTDSENVNIKSSPSIETETEGEIQSNLLKQVEVIENLDITGRVTNLEEVKWHDAKIEVEEGKISFSVYLDNTNKDEKVEARKLELNFMDKTNKVAYTKEVQMEELEDKFGHTKIETELEMEYPIIVYNLEIIATN